MFIARSRLLESCRGACTFLSIRPSLHRFPKQTCEFHGKSQVGSRAITDPENKGNRQVGVNFDTLGSWNSRMDLPLHYEQSIKQGKPIPKVPLEEIGVASLIGRRKVNEDRYVIKELTPDILYFGVFDGHGGSLAAEYVCDFLQDHLKFWLKKTPDLSVVLHHSFLDVNNNLARHLAHYHLTIDNLSTGTTATVCLLRNSTELVVGHVGDSRAILCRSNKPVRLSQDDHPDEPAETNRILEMGGRIMYNSLGEPLVNGRLAMTRSIGDLQLKQSGVIAKPHIRSIKVKHGKDAFLVLATDGLFFSLSDEEIVSIINSFSVPEEAANILSDQALQYGSEDNTTAMIIPLGAWGKYRQQTNSIPYSFGRSLIGGSGSRN